MTRSISPRDLSAILDSIATRRSFADLMAYEAALKSGPRPERAEHPSIVAAVAKRRAELDRAAWITEPN